MPGIALSSLRVDASFDASSYVTGMQRKTAANAKAIASSDRPRRRHLCPATRYSTTVRSNS